MLWPVSSWHPGSPRRWKMDYSQHPLHIQLCTPGYADCCHSIYPCPNFRSFHSSMWKLIFHAQKRVVGASAQYAAQTQGPAYSARFSKGPHSQVQVLVAGFIDEEAQLGETPPLSRCTDTGWTGARTALPPLKVGSKCVCVRVTVCSAPPLLCCSATPLISLTAFTCW